MATEEQLRERWHTLEGEDIKQKIAEHIKEADWEKFLTGFPFVEEVGGKDLRFINLSDVNLVEKEISSYASFDYEGERISDMIADLEEANLEGANLKGANLKGTNLKKAKLTGTDFEGADLEEANFQGSQTFWTKFRNANLKGADFWRVDLMGADFSGADLEDINLEEANLEGAILEGVNLINAILKGSILTRANLKKSYLNKAYIVEANLEGAILEGAKLNNADLMNSCLNRANLSGADLSNTNIYGISAWDIITDENTVMKNLIINENPLVTVDDIEIAQFIYMISNNKKIRNVIDSMRTKGVLILGSFDDKTKSILNKITDILKENDLIPMVFYFEGSKELSLMDTVKTMALLSRFVIIDLSERSGQLFEIGNLSASSIKVPYATIASEGTRTTDMVKDLRCFDWCINHYEDQCKDDYLPYPKVGWETALPILIKDTIIPWADGVNEKLRKRNDR